MVEKTKSKDVKVANPWPSSEEEGELAVDLCEDKNDLILQAVIGGVVIGDLDISITNDMITIRGERNREDKDKVEKVYYNECFWGPFSRSLVLPHEINADKAKAVIKNGMLTIHLPKLVKTKRKILKIEEE